MPPVDPKSFEEKIGVAFKNHDLLRQALTHRSYINERPRADLTHNERLEFLGDAVLELVVTEYLYKKFPQATEGEMTAYRAALVNTEMLAATASGLGMNSFLLLSRGEARDTGRARQAILANAFESVIGAIFLDAGYAKARSFIARHLFPRTEEIVRNQLWQDAKSHFQQKAQEVEGVTPTYQVLGETGPDHSKIFTVGLYIGEKLVTRGKGPSKQRAEQEAARAGLQLRGWE